MRTYRLLALGRSELALEARKGADCAVDDGGGRVRGARVHQEPGVAKGDAELEDRGNALKGLGLLALVVPANVAPSNPTHTWPHAHKHTRA